MASPIDTLIDRIARRLTALDITERDASIKATGKPDALRYVRVRRAMPSADRLEAIAKALETAPEWLLGRSSVPPTPPEVPPVRGSADADGPVALKRINMGFSMGDGSNLDDIVDEGTLDFDANLLRLLTPSPYKYLFVADGNGDSMQPTLLDSDIIVIDTMQNTLNKWDRIWAISLQGAGAVKRIGMAERGKVEIMSDNPIVPNKVVPIEDVRIIGRVVYSGRRH
jgi:phage repressor protein C with HTH and peptisase S24 domain